MAPEMSHSNREKLVAVALVEKLDLVPLISMCLESLDGSGELEHILHVSSITVYCAARHRRVDLVSE